MQSLRQRKRLVERKLIILDHDSLISKIREIIIEDLGVNKVRIFKGTGATHSYNTKSGSSMLGDLDPFDVEEDPGDLEDFEEIEVSKVFIDESLLSEKDDRKFKSKYSEKINYRKNPEKYQTSRDSQGVYTVEPYKSELHHLFKFSSPEIAKKSANLIYEKFIKYRDKKDSIGMDMTRKYLQLGYQISRRFSLYPSGKRHLGQGKIDREMREAAEVFKSSLVKVMKDAKYNPF